MSVPPDETPSPCEWDLNNRDWPDVAASNTNSPAVILPNEASADNPARWLAVKLVGRGNRNMAGMTATLEGDGRRLTRFVKGGGGYLSSSDRRRLFGLGASGTRRRLTVQWC